ncbi:MAG: HYR domain-containing protein, partial [Planctomycetes bacterium]|nr:HYR domain-containing protein [Planctomycetota bacterium]
MPSRRSASWVSVCALSLACAAVAHGQAKQNVSIQQPESADAWRTHGGRVSLITDIESLASLGLRLEGTRSNSDVPTPAGMRAEFTISDGAGTGLFFTTQRDAFRGIAEGDLPSLGLLILTTSTGDAYLIGDLDFQFAPTTTGFPSGRATDRFGTNRDVFDVSGGFVQFDAARQELQWTGIDVRLDAAFAHEIGVPEAGGAVIARLGIEAPALPTNEVPSAGPIPPPGEGSGGDVYAASGPDVIVGAVAGEGSSDIIRHGRDATLGITAYSVETTSCNIGTQNVLWISNNNQHPVIGQDLYRLKNGRFEEIGQSWLKHGFFALSSGWCFTDCQPTDGSSLGVHCSDAYSASLNGTQNNLGPKWQVNAATGVYPYPPANPSTPATIGRRLQAHDADIDPAQNSGALYFVEGHYVTADDAAAGNKNNNASYRRVQFTGTAPTFSMSLVTGQSTHQQSPGIQAWKDQDAAVTLVNVDIASDGRMILGYKVTDNGNGTWHYEWALYNMNSDRSGQAFSVPVGAGVTLTNVGFHDVDYHSGDGIGNVNRDGTDWTFTNSGGVATWATSTFATNQNANALRWGTLYNFRFDANVAPQSGNATIALFTSGSPASVTAATQVPISSCTDVTPPVITCPANQTREATSASGAVVTFTPTATDDCTASPAISCVPASGATFALGTTTVNCTATDNASRTASCSFTVTVRDTTAPAIICSGNLTRECTSASGATVTFTTSASDAVDPSPIVTCSPTSGSLFPFGTTTVTCSASDHASPPNTSAPCSFTVTVRDTTAPTITCSSNVTTECTGPSGATASFTVTATDACDASPSVSCAPASGSTFPVGTTTVNCTATDHAVPANSRSCSFTVTVRDTTGPTITCPANISTACTSTAGAVVTYSATATDTCDASPTVSCAPASGASFAVGTTTVNCSASAHASPVNTRTCSFTVTVTDTTAPTITCPANITAQCTNASGAAVSFTTTASDSCDANPTVSCAPASGSTFGFGTTTVNCTASDHASPPNTRSCSFTVTVQDTTAPTLTCAANVTAEATSASGATVNYNVTASDACDASPTLSCLPASGSIFGFGTTTVNCTASDHASPVNTRSCSFTVTVRDTTAPALTCPADFTAACTSPSDANVTYSVTATDAVDPAPTLSC